MELREPFTLLSDQIGEDAAEHQLPESRQRRIEGGDRLVHHVDDIVGKRDGGNGYRGEEKAAFTSPDQAEDERPENVELLLDGERPQMQQRLGIARYVEITGFAPQHKISRKTRAGRQMLA